MSKEPGKHHQFARRQPAMCRHNAIHPEQIQKMLQWWSDISKYRSNEIWYMCIMWYICTVEQQNMQNVCVFRYNYVNLCSIVSCKRVCDYNLGVTIHGKIEHKVPSYWRIGTPCPNPCPILCVVSITQGTTMLKKQKVWTSQHASLHFNGGSGNLDVSHRQCHIGIRYT